MTKQTYTEMVDSGIERIGKIPKGWEVIRNRHIMKYAKGKAPSEFFDEAESGEYIPYLSMEYLRGDSDIKNYVDSKDKCVIANNGDLLLLRDGSNAGEFIEVKYGEGVISSTLAKLEIDNKFDQRYYFYLSKYFESRLKDLSIGMGIPHVSGSVLKDLPYFLFDKKEQQAIATYLDIKTAQIDQAIALKTQQIELLREKRSALINHVVTKGLDPDVELVESGIERIGKIPKGWEVRKLKYCGNVINGATPTSDNGDYRDGEIIWVTPAEINDIIYLSDSVRKITQEGYNSCGTSLVPINSLILTTRAPIGKLAIAKKELCTNQGCKSIVLKDEDSKFMYYQIISRIRELQEAGTGTTFMELGTQELKEFMLICPSPQEQQSIASYLDSKTAEIDQTIVLVQQSIDLLVEYKQSLISHVVTGKVKVG